MCVSYTSVEQFLVLLDRDTLAASCAQPAVYTYDMDDSTKPSPSASDSIITIRLKRPSKWLAIGVVVALLILATVLVPYTYHGSTSKITSEEFKPVQHSAPFPVYYPAVLPHSLHLNSRSIIFGDNIVTYSIVDKKGESLAASEQIVAKSFNFSKFYKDNVQVSAQQQIPQGTLTLGKFNGLQVCMLVTQKTWIIINDTTGNHQVQLGELCRNLKTT